MPTRITETKVRHIVDEARARASAIQKPFSYALEIILGNHGMSKFSRSPNVITKHDEMKAAALYYHAHGTLPRNEPASNDSEHAENMPRLAPHSTLPHSWIDSYYGNSEDKK